MPLIGEKKRNKYLIKRVNRAVVHLATPPRFHVKKQYASMRGHVLNIESRNMFYILSQFNFSGVDMPNANAKTNKTRILVEVVLSLFAEKTQPKSVELGLCQF